MKYIKTIQFILLSAILTLSCENKKSNEEKSGSDPALAVNKRPNIIVILADDLGFNDIGANGNKIIPTPNIDSLAASGVRFTHAYTTAPICSPSRAALITGRYQHRFGAEFLASGSYGNYNFSKAQLADRNSKFEKPGTFDSTFVQGLPASEITLAELFKKQGYQTAIIGKWHLGQQEPLLPLNSGFDYHYGFYAGATLYNDTADSKFKHKILPWVSSDISSWNRKKGRAIYRGKNEIQEKEYLTFAIAKEATQFIEKNKDLSFFLYLPFNAPHTPFQAPKEYYDKFSSIQDEHKRVYYAMINALDDAIGQVIQKLKETGQDKNTLIVFTSDNGGATYTRAADNTPLRGGKLSQFEGGMRVPFIISYPGKFPTGKVFEKTVSTLDIFVTAAAVTNTSLPEDRPYDGVNLLPFVKGDSIESPHKTLFWRNGYVKTIKDGNWKLQINTGPNKNKIYLFNLETDPSETNNLATKETQKVTDLKIKLEVWEKNMKEPLWKYFRSNRVDVGQGDSLFFPI